MCYIALWGDFGVNFAGFPVISDWPLVPFSNPWLLSPSPGPGDGPVGRAAAGLGRGDPGRGPAGALGEAMVPWGPDWCYHLALHVSLTHT